MYSYVYTCMYIAVYIYIYVHVYIYYTYRYVCQHMYICAYIRFISQNYSVLSYEQRRRPACNLSGFKPPNFLGPRKFYLTDMIDLHISMCVYIFTYEYNHPEVDKTRAMYKMYYGSVKDHILSTPGWLCLCIYIYIYIYTHTHPKRVEGD